MPRGTLKSSLLFMGTLGAVRGAPHSAGRLQVPAELDGIVQGVQAFAEAWFEGDEAALERCLHPDLISRVLEAGPRESVPPRLGKALGFMDLLGAPARMGLHTDPGHRRPEVSVLDVRGHAASVRAILGDWVAYIHLVAFRGRWAVVNVLWEWAKPLGA